MANHSAFLALKAILVDTLTRTGVYVGSTAGYPRVEVNSIIENERLEKSGALRGLTVTIDSITTDSLIVAHQLNNTNLELIEALTGEELHGYRIDGIVFTQLQEGPETSDTQNILYRISQNIDFYLTMIGDDE